MFKTHASPRGPCVAIQLYSAIHYTAIHRYTLYRLYNTPLGFGLAFFWGVLDHLQLRARRDRRDGPRPSGHWTTSFPDTFEPERVCAAQCEGLQPGHRSPPKLCFAEGRLTIIHLAAARAPWLHAARMPGVVTSAGTTLGELILTRQQHSIARSASGPGTDTMVSHGRCGSSRGEEAGDLPKLSSTDGWWYAA